MKKSHLIGGAVTVVVLVGVFVFILPKVADYRAVWDVIQGLTWEEVLLLLAAELLNLSTFAPPYMAALPGLTYWRGEVITQASTASTYIAPGGAAVGMGVSFAMLRGWGFRPAAVGLAVTITGIWNQLFMLLAPAVALGLLTRQGGTSSTLKLVAWIGFVLFVLALAGFIAVLINDRPARWIGNHAARAVTWGMKLIRRKPVTWTGESFIRFRHQTVGLIKRRWHVLTLATLAGQLSVFVVLVVCLRILGVHTDQVSGVEVFAAWTLARILGSIPITPGGIGFVELGLTGALVGFGGPNEEVVAAVLLYRTVTIVPTLLLGLVAATLWKRMRPEEAVQPT